jgi:TFIIF-interacting CTD phosphatase-like protein
MYNLVLWTAGREEYADLVLKASGLEQFFPKESRRYRQHCDMPKFLNRKRLFDLGHGLKRVILVDDSYLSHSAQLFPIDNDNPSSERVPSNGILIKSMTYMHGQDRTPFHAENMEILEVNLESGNCLFQGFGISRKG